MRTLEQLSLTIRGLYETVATELSSLDLNSLNYKVSSDSWSVLECLEHLNRYSRYYNPALSKAIAHNHDGPCEPVISYSWLGKKSLDMVRPQNMKKHKTVKHMNPNNSQLNRATIEEFLNHQVELLSLLEGAKNTNLNKKAVPVEFFKLLKLRIGEALEFIVLHEERHIQQALRGKQRLAHQTAA
ncbi:DinB family protein [Pontibacter ummariensis]|uniref:DinB superfamily protein n=1 Tax=Pontibacter ummariensis TaxID=1610492 RepID=A0A239CW17_9BACT|nr:DinB family protein [Pontibacter ummariensis]PRY14796.1 DinB family protein [Pontibacter ummariensis]SNS24290.1 DinB superfamily protein [Pontibacter ummariensis]